MAEEKNNLQSNGEFGPKMTKWAKEPALRELKLDIENTHISRERANELGTKQDTQSFNMEQELQAR